MKWVHNILYWFYYGALHASKGSRNYMAWVKKQYGTYWVHFALIMIYHIR